MVQNILFDMGNVLIRFDPPAFLGRLGLPEADAALLDRVVFRSVTWVRLDRGDLSDREALALMTRWLPTRLHAAAEELVCRWDRWADPLPGMTELAEDLAAAGCGLYLLTNAARRHRDYWPAFPMAPLFGDRIMLSADWRLLKPDPAFFEKALSLFSLDRSACLFIDDSPLNAESAQRCGLPSLVFHGDAALLRQDLRERGVTI